jgi:hypothetical protein
MTYFWVSVIAILVMIVFHPMFDEIRNDNSVGYVFIQEGNNNFIMVEPHTVYWRFGIPYLMPPLQVSYQNEHFYYTTQVISNDSVTMDAHINFMNPYVKRPKKMMQLFKMYGIHWGNITARKETESSVIKQARQIDAERLRWDGFYVDNPHREFASDGYYMALASFRYADKWKEAESRARYKVNGISGYSSMYNPSYSYQNELYYQTREEAKDLGLIDAEPTEDKPYTPIIVRDTPVPGAYISYETVTGEEVNRRLKERYG